MAQLQCPNCKNIIQIPDLNMPGNNFCPYCGYPMRQSAPFEPNEALKQANIMLKSKNFDGARALLEELCAHFPNNPYTYVGLLLCETSTTSTKMLAELPYPFDASPYYAKIMQYGNDALKNEINGYLNTVKSKAAMADEIYNSAAADLAIGTPADVIRALEKLESIRTWRDADIIADKCRRFLETYNIPRQQAAPMQAEQPQAAPMQAEQPQTAPMQVEQPQTAPMQPEQPQTAPMQVEQPQAASMQAEQPQTAPMQGFPMPGPGMQGMPSKPPKRPKKRKSNTFTDEFAPTNAGFDTPEGKKKKSSKKKLFIILGAVIVLLGLLAFGYFYFLRPMLNYDKALDYYNNKKYDKAITAFTELGNYKDSAEYITKSKYNLALTKEKLGENEEALKLFTELGDYKDSAEYAKLLENEIKYKEAMAYIEDGNTKEAAALLKELDDYKDCKEKLTEIENEAKYSEGLKYLEDGDCEKATECFEEILGYKDSSEKLTEARYYYALMCMENKDWETAIKLFALCPDYLDSEELYDEANLSFAEALYAQNDYEAAKAIYEQYEGYEDKIENCTLEIAIADIGTCDYMSAYKALYGIRSNESAKALLDNFIALPMNTTYNTDDTTSTSEYESLITNDAYGRTTQISYFSDEEIIKTYSISYDDSGNVAKFQITVPGGTNYDFDYTYNSNGDILTVTSKEGSASPNITVYTYDAQNRLIKQSDETYDITYVYEEDTGDLLANEYHKHGDSEILMTIVYDFDDNGNMVGEMVLDDGSSNSLSNIYEYNEDGKLISTYSTEYLDDELIMQEQNVYTYNELGLKNGEAIVIGEEIHSIRTYTNHVFAYIPNNEPIKMYF